MGVSFSALDHTGVRRQSVVAVAMLYLAIISPRRPSYLEGMLSFIPRLLGSELALGWTLQAARHAVLLWPAASAGGSLLARIGALAAIASSALFARDSARHLGSCGTMVERAAQQGLAVGSAVLTAGGKGEAAEGATESEAGSGTVGLGMAGGAAVAGKMDARRVLATIAIWPPLCGKDVVCRRGVVYATVPRCTRPSHRPGASTAKGAPVQMRALKVDVYRSKASIRATAAGAPTPPILMYVHGGGWTVGHRAFANVPLLRETAAKGWTVVSISYRLAPKAVWPAQLVDCKRAVAWTRERAAAGDALLGAEGAGGTPPFVVAGESAGGHLSCMLALTEGEVALAAGTPDEAPLQPGFEDGDTRVDAVIDIYGAHDMVDSEGRWRALGSELHLFLQAGLMQTKMRKHPAAWRDLSPMAHLRRHLEARQRSRANSTVAPQPSRGLPPFLGVHGDLDTLVPIEDSRAFYRDLKKYRQAGNQPETTDLLVEVPGAHHAFTYLPSPRTFTSNDVMFAFMERVRHTVEAASSGAGHDEAPVYIGSQL